MMAVVACVTTAIVLLFAVCKVAPRTGLALWHFSARWYAGIRLIRTGIIIVLHCEAPLKVSHKNSGLLSLDHYHCCYNLSSIFAAASCTLSYRWQTALHLVSMILVRRSFWTCFRISLTLLNVNLGRPFTEEKGKSPVPFWGKPLFHIFQKSNWKERNLEKVEFQCAFWKILNFCLPHGFIAVMA